MRHTELRQHRPRGLERLFRLLAVPGGAHPPVEVIAGDAISKAERYLVPAGIGSAALALILLAVD
jgi:hypothetical protein